MSGCSVCLGKNRESNRVQCNARISRGLCRCGGRRDVGKRHCAKCLKKGRERNGAKRTAEKSRGHCRCGRPRVEGRENCAVCLVAALKLQEKRRRTMAGRGLCACGAPLVIAADGRTMSRCAKCLASQCAMQRAKVKALHARGLCICRAPLAHRDGTPMSRCENCLAKRARHAVAARAAANGRVAPPRSGALGVFHTVIGTQVNSYGRYPSRKPCRDRAARDRLLELVRREPGWPSRGGSPATTRSMPPQHTPRASQTSDAAGLARRRRGSW